MGEAEIKSESLNEAMEDLQSDSADKIDMSLDEIIKLNKKEQKASRAASRARTKRVLNRNNVLKKLSQTPQPRRGFKHGALQFQGPSRSRGLRRPRGSGRGGALRGHGLSPLNRPSTSTVTEEQLGQTTVSQRGAFRGRGRGRGRGGLSRGALSARGQRGSQRGGRPFILDRGFAAARGSSKLERYQKIRSQRSTTLTVSLPNAKLTPETQVRPRRGGALLRGRSSEAMESQAPKGVPLRFNYKATTNQTGVSLNDRFTSLRIRGWGMKAQTGRGRGRGRGRGETRGERSSGVKDGLVGARGGRGRSRAGRGGARGSARTSRGARGSARTVVLQ